MIKNSASDDDPVLWKKLLLQTNEQVVVLVGWWPRRQPSSALSHGKLSKIADEDSLLLVLSTSLVIRGQCPVFSEPRAAVR